MASTRARSARRRDPEKPAKERSVSRSGTSRTKAETARANGKKGGRPPAPRDVEAYLAAGPPPADPLKLDAWTHKILGIALWRIAIDTKLTEDQRRSKMTSVARAIGSLTPKARLRAAEANLRKHAKKMEAPANAPPLEERPPAEDDGEVES